MVAISPGPQFHRRLAGAERACMPTDELYFLQRPKTFALPSHIDPNARNETP
jgi:hypothetical protein